MKEEDLIEGSKTDDDSRGSESEERYSPYDFVLNWGPGINPNKIIVAITD